MTKIAAITPSSITAVAEPKLVPSLPLADQIRLDAMILDAASHELCKIALLISKVTDAATAASFEVAPQSIAARIYIMVDIGKLIVQGNVRRWRSGEVKRA